MDAVPCSLISVLKSNVLFKELQQNKKRMYESLMIGIAVSNEGKKSKRQKIRNYVEEVVPSYSMDDFKSHFRITKSSTEEIIKLINTKREMRVKKGRPLISSTKEVLLSIWTLANQESFRGIGDRFGVNKGHAHTIFIDFCQKMCRMIGKFIRWPNDNLERTVHKFEELRTVSLPGVIGCVDGTHIYIKAPKEDSQSYYNRKGRHSILLQIICDSEMRIIDAFVGWPGSANDSRVWQQSPIYNKFLNESSRYLGDKYYLLGDSAYPLDTFLIVPYKDYGNLTVKQKNFNRKHSSIRVVVEQTIGLLKGRFRRLKYLDMENISSMSKVVMTSCILHNLCINQGDIDCIEDIFVDDNNEPAEDPISRNRTAAEVKRNQLADLLMQN
ncbi:putative nuclease HARBI1 [Centruroides vittatus]|uniref:putative nuclease HARBI1 n=1 Tax=Centruroides vittatus TaxID=120091 RepID=UPI00350F27FA